MYACVCYTVHFVVVFLMLIGERGKFLQLFFFPLAIIHFAIMTIKVDSLSKLSLVWHTDTHHTAIWRSITMIDYVWPTKLNLRNTSNYVHTSSLILGNAFQKKKKIQNEAWTWTRYYICVLANFCRVCACALTRFDQLWPQQHSRRSFQLFISF